MNAIQEHEKLEATSNFREHIEQAQKETTVNNKCIKRARETCYENADNLASFTLPSCERFKYLV